MNIAKQTLSLVAIQLAYMISFTKLLKIKPGNPQTFDFKNIGKLTSTVALSVFTQQYLIKQGYLTGKVDTKIRYNR